MKLIKLLRFLASAFSMILIPLLFSTFSFAADPPAGQSPQYVQGEVLESPQYVQDEVLVRFREWVLPHEKASAHAVIGAVPIKDFEIVDGLQLVKLPQGMHVKEAIELYRQHPGVLYAEPNYMSPRGIPTRGPVAAQPHKYRLKTGYHNENPRQEHASARSGAETCNMPGDHAADAARS